MCVLVFRNIHMYTWNEKNAYAHANPDFFFPGNVETEICCSIDWECLEKRKNLVTLITRVISHKILWRWSLHSWNAATFILFVIIRSLDVWIQTGSGWFFFRPDWRTCKLTSRRSSWKITNWHSKKWTKEIFRCISILQTVNFDTCVRNCRHCFFRCTTGSY